MTSFMLRQLYSQHETHITPWIGSWVWPKVGLGVLEKKKIPRCKSKQPRICSQQRSHGTYLKINYEIKTFPSKRSITLGAVFPYSLRSLYVYIHVSLPSNSDSILNNYAYNLTSTIGTTQVTNYKWPMCTCECIYCNSYRCLCWVL